MSKKYKKNYLTNVIFRVDFLKSVELSSLRIFTEKISNIYPLSKQIDGEEGFIDFDLKTKIINQKTNKIVSWDFFDKNKTKKLNICSSSLFIEYYKYNNSSDLIIDAEKIVKEFVELFGVKTIRRMGLRYVNEINIENEKNFLDWTKYINKDLLGEIVFAGKESLSVSRAMGQLVFKDGFNSLNFNYGIYNNDFPNEINKKSFILDYDYYSNIPIDTSETNLIDTVKDYNKKIEKLFESSITDAFRKLLNK